MKIKSVAKGFTLIELLVVVLIIGILSAVALPMYRKAVERSRASDALTTMQAIAKSEHGWYLMNNSYTTDFSDLDIDLTDVNGNKADNASFANALYTYELVDTGILASRNNDEYYLYKDYENSQIMCAPSGHYICENLGGFTKVPCEKAELLWANSNNTCYLDPETRCKEVNPGVNNIWHEEENPENSYCAYIDQGGKTLQDGTKCVTTSNDSSHNKCQSSIVNDGGECVSTSNSGWHNCNSSTINKGGKCIVNGGGRPCEGVRILGGECTGTGGQACWYSSITAGGICSANETSGNRTGCSYAKIYSGGKCTSNCYGSEIYDGGICSGDCGTVKVYSGGICLGGCSAATIYDGGICKSSKTNACYNVSAQYYRTVYSGTGCCEGDYCGNAPKCNCPIDEETGMHKTSC